MQVDIYSDIVCPWCYVGERRFFQALAAYPQADAVDVRFRPYQLDPDAPDAAEPTTAYLERRFGRLGPRMLQPVDAAAATVGLSFDWDRMLSANTKSAHRLMEWALREAGPAAQRALAEELFALHFLRGGNIADLDRLAGAAGAAGLDPEQARQWLASDRGVAELDAAFQAARDLGVRAVPTFVFNGRHAVEGAQSTELFVRVLEEMTNDQ